MRIVVTAGFDRALPAVLLCELLRREGKSVAGVIVATPFSVRRLRSLLLQRGVAGLVKTVKRLAPASASRTRDAVEEFAERHAIPERSLKRWCAHHRVMRVVVPDLNAPVAARALGEMQPDVVIYAGGGILRKPFLDAANNRVLNAHCGPLPQIRGMNAIEWAVLLGHEPGVTLHYIDEGIDTGRIVSSAAIKVTRGEPVAQLRARAVVKGIEETVSVLAGLTDLASAAGRPNAGAAEGRQCYIMAPALLELLQVRLDRLDADA